MIDAAVLEGDADSSARPPTRADLDRARLARLRDDATTVHRLWCSLGLPSCAALAPLTHRPECCS